MLHNITCEENEKLCAQTHRIEKECQEELSPLDALVQDLWAPRVLVIVHGVCEQSTGLAWKNLSTQE